jgi:stage III sporulation protein AE
LIKPYSHLFSWKPLPTLLLIFGLWLGLNGTLHAETPAEAIIKAQAEHLKTDQVSQYWDKLMNEYGGYFPENKTPSFMELLLGTKGFSISSMLKGILNYFFHELVVNGKLLASIMLLTVFSMILETLQSSFEKNTVSKLGYSIAYMVLIILAINSFSVAIGYAKGAITSMIEFMLAVVPLLLTLLASMGNITSVAILHPLIVFMVHSVGTAIYIFVFPLLFFSTVLHIVSSLSDKYKVTQLANLLRTISISLLGIFVTVFLAVISIQGGAGAITDGVTLRTAKYITGNFVPVVGRLFSDATETVIGLTGVAIIMLLCAFPAIKILTLALIYNLSAAIIQPLGDNPIIACLQTIGKNMIYVFAALAAVGLMFFLAITILITVSNVSVMVR